MDHKLQEITDKLYQEGVVKGNVEADRIIVEANERATSIIENAKKEAEAIIADAAKKVDELNRNTRSELQMASKQLVSALEQEIVTHITGKITNDAVKQTTDDKQFMQQLMVNAVEKWVSEQSPKVFVAPAEKKAVEDYFASKAIQLLDKGFTIESANNVKAGFQIGPIDGSYKVSFTHEDFVNFFQEFIRPKVVDLLFGQK
jgi:V/A-type H+-transporting ATPase subunit E